MTETDVMTNYIDKTMATIDEFIAEPKPVTQYRITKFEDDIAAIRGEYKTSLSELREGAT